MKIDTPVTKKCPITGKTETVYLSKIPTTDIYICQLCNNGHGGSACENCITEETIKANKK